MSSIASRLRKIRNEKGLTQVELAQLAHTTQPSIQRIESGQSTGTRVIKQLAKALDVSPSWLLFGNDKNAEEKRQLNFRYIPVIDWVSAGDGSLAEALPSDESEYIAVPKKACGPNSYILTIKGDSMESPQQGKKTFLSGEKIVVDPEKRPISGCYVVALINTNSEAVFKQYFEDGPRQYLKPLNPQYPIIEMTDEMKIIGIVVAHFDYRLLKTADL